MEHIDVPVLQPPADATTSRRPSQESAKSKAASSNSFRSTISSLSSSFSRKSGTSTVHTSRSSSEARDQGSVVSSPHDSLHYLPPQLLENLNAHNKNVVAEEEEVRVKGSDDAGQDIVTAARKSAGDALVDVFQELSPSSVQQESAITPSKVLELTTPPVIASPPNPSLPIQPKPHTVSSSSSRTASVYQRIPSSHATTSSWRHSTLRHLATSFRRPSKVSTTPSRPQPPTPRIKARKPLSKKLGAFFCRSANPDTDSDNESYHPVRVGQLKPHLNYHYRLKEPTSQRKRPGRNSAGFSQCSAHVQSSTRSHRYSSTRNSFRSDVAAGSRPGRPRSNQGGSYVDPNGNRGYIPRYAEKGMPAVKSPPRVRSAVDGASRRRSKPRRQRQGDPVKRDPARKGGPEPGPRSGDFRQIERPEGPEEGASNTEKTIEGRKEKGKEYKVKNRLSTASTLKPEPIQRGDAHAQNAAMYEKIENGAEDKAKDRLSTASTVLEGRSPVDLPSTPELKKSALEVGTYNSTRRSNPKAKAYTPTNPTDFSSSQKKSRRRKSSIPLIRQTITEEENQTVLYPTRSKVDSEITLGPSEREMLVRRAWKRARKDETRFERAARKLSRGRIDSEIGMCMRECGMEDVLWKCFGAEDGQEDGQENGKKKKKKKKKIGDSRRAGKGKSTQEKKRAPKKSVNMTSLKKRVVMGGRTVDAS